MIFVPFSVIFISSVGGVGEGGVAVTPSHFQHMSDISLFSRSSSFKLSIPVLPSVLSEKVLNHLQTLDSTDSLTANMKATVSLSQDTELGDYVNHRPNGSSQSAARHSLDNRMSEVGQARQHESQEIFINLKKCQRVFDSDKAAYVVL